MTEPTRPVPRSRHTASTRAIESAPDVGDVSRPSVNAWITRSGTFRSAASAISAFRCSSEECTPPVDTRPIRCTRSDPRSAARSVSFRASEPSRTAASMRARSWGTIAPAPRLRWPTSELPICPSGRPTASPLAVRVVCGCSAHSRSNTGVSASATALPGPSGARPSRRARRGRRPTPSCARRDLDDRTEVAGVEARAADERAVDVREREQLGRVVGLERAAVEDPHRSGGVRVEPGHQRADERDRLLRLLRRRDLAGADRPYRLVRDDDLGQPSGGDQLEPLLHLVAQLALGLAALALGLGLADAQDRGEPGLERLRNLQLQRAVGLVEVLAP